MAVFCYTTEDGETVERFFPAFKKVPGSVTLDDGREAVRDIAATHRDSRHKPNANWPMCSDAAGVAPEQVGEAMAHADSIGIPTRFLSDGRAVFESRKHRKDYCRAIGLHDRNGGYGDP